MDWRKAACHRRVPMIEWMYYAEAGSEFTVIILILLLLFFLFCVVEFVVCCKVKGQFAKLVPPLLSPLFVLAFREWAYQWEGGSMISLVDIAALIVWGAILSGCLVGWLSHKLWRHL